MAPVVGLAEGNTKVTWFVYRFPLFSGKIFLSHQKCGVKRDFQYSGESTRHDNPEDHKGANHSAITHISE